MNTVIEIKLECEEYINFRNNSRKVEKSKGIMAIQKTLFFWKLKKMYCSFNIVITRCIFLYKFYSFGFTLSHFENSTLYIFIEDLSWTLYYALLTEVTSFLPHEV